MIKALRIVEVKMRVFTLICLFFAVITALRADPLYTWITPPITPYVNPEGTTVYSGIIVDDSGAYPERTVQYEGKTFDVDVATFRYPDPNEVDFFVLTLGSGADDPASIPEPNLFPSVFIALVIMTLCHRRTARILLSCREVTIATRNVPHVGAYRHNDSTE
jgi:hypothetical protein